MIKLAPGLLYTKDDEWLRLQGDEAVIGISDYAQDSLSDIVFLELPEVGASFDQGDAFGVVESVKAAADLYMPVGGVVIAINSDLVADPEQVNNAPYEAWLVRIKLSDPAQAASLMDVAAYATFRDIS
jgi:glycine cleavage system H protein